jgi:lipoyl(octanoyl) transferase
MPLGKAAWQWQSVIMQIQGIDWQVEGKLIPYPHSLAAMEARASGIAAGQASEQIWLLEHPPLYTAGTSADPAELLDPRFPVFRQGGVGAILITARGSGWAMFCSI